MTHIMTYDQTTQRPTKLLTAKT